MAEFRYYLNRQGARGPQGPQGEKGFSPDISVEKDTLSEYVLRITNEGGYFLTTNLREHKEDRGGTYIRYDRATGVMYAGDAELATTDTLGVIRIAGNDDFTGKAEDTAVTPAQVQDYTAEKITEVNQRTDSLDVNNVKVTGNQSIAGTKTFTDGIVADRVSLSNGNSVLRPDAGRLKIGSTSNTAGTKLEGPYVEVRGTNVDIYGKFTAHGFADFNYNTTFYQDAIIKGSVKDDNNNLYLKQNTITAGDNVQITNTADGIKISSTAQGDVTLAGDNSFTGNNTFDGVSTFNGDTWVDFLKIGTSLTNQQDKKFLAQGSITAGDNVTIEETTDGVKISSTGGGSSEPPANMVTTDTDQLIKGTKIFNSGQTFFQRGFILGKLESISTSGTISKSLLTYNDYYSEVGIDDRTTKILGSQVVDGSNKKFLVQGSITAGDNVTIEETTDGVKISSTGGGSSEPPANMVTTDTDQLIKGTKIFNSGQTFFQRGFILGKLESISTSGTISKSLLTYNDYYSEVGIDDRTTKILGSQVVDGSNKKFLVQGSITAGSDNLIIADTTDGVQITCNAPTNAQIEALQRLINDLSTKVDNLTTRLNNLEK